MADIVLDSSVLIDHLRGRAEATEFLLRQGRTGRVLVPALAAWELWKGATTPRRKAGVQELLASVEVEPFGPALAQLAAEVFLQLRREGRTKPEYDVLIASHAIFRNAPLATRDRDYEGIPGLEVVKVA